MKRETQTEKQNQQEDQEDLRRGPWTLEEDTLLIHYVACRGEGRWNLLAKSAALKRTGKSCRLRWLNYLKPDIKRGNLSPQEQLLILELHSKWGNRWSKIAAHLPGRTDNEIKNYWRTRVQKQARQLNMESNSQSFIDVIRCFYMPRLVEKIEQNSNDSTTMNMDDEVTGGASQSHNIVEVSSSTNLEQINFANTKDTSSTNNSLSNSVQDHSTSKGSCLQLGENNHNCTCDMDLGTMSMSMSASDFPFSSGHVDGNNWLGCDMAGDGMWDLDELWQSGSRD